MGNLVFQATLGGQVSLVGPNTASTFTLNVPAVSSTLATLAAQTFTGTQTMSTLTSPAATSLLLQSAGTTAITLDTSQNATFAGKVASAGSLLLASNGTTTAVTIDTSQNVGVGVTPSAWNTSFRGLQFGGAGCVWSSTSGFAGTYIGNNYYYSASGRTYQNTNTAVEIALASGGIQFSVAPSGTAGTVATFTQAMTLEGTTSPLISSVRRGISVLAPSGTFVAASFANDGGVSAQTMEVWNKATTGNNSFISFSTEGTATERGSISYNRGAGLVAYNATSDYRSKTVTGTVENALSKLALLKPCSGRMNGAEIDIDFFVAHELQEVVPSAVTGEKDAVNEDNTPKYQMVDKSALIPLLTAALQEQQALITQLQADVAALKG
jgi:hypothetical protein